MNATEFEILLAKYEKDVYSFCRYLAGEEAGDLYQDTVLAVFEMRDKINSGLNPKSLFLSVAVGKWKNWRRKTGRRNAIAPQVSPEELNDPPTPKSESPEAQAQSAFEREAIGRAMDALPDKFRIPLILHYFEENALESISEICQIPKGTVKSRLHKGRALLKTALEKEGFA
jgi:RNA polymerase sigma-70 factor (ECF subfamily)